MQPTCSPEVMPMRHAAAATESRTRSNRRATLRPLPSRISVILIHTLCSSLAVVNPNRRAALRFRPAALILIHTLRSSLVS
eukprot:4379263-Prymnesium_polylepis.2